jgi:hypothetical protein
VGQVAPAPAVSQDAATSQANAAGAIAAQPQQSNSLGADRSDSTGGETISQQNGLSVVGAAANDASTSQAPDPGAAASSDQQAATDQDASANSAAVQPQQSNVVIIIRINSPGDDVVSQTNVVSVVAVGANQSSTAQGIPAPEDASATGAVDPSGQAEASAPQSAPQSTTQAAPQSVSGAQIAPPVAQSPSTAEQPTRPPAVGVQQLRPQAVRVLSILAFTASSEPDAAARSEAASSAADPLGPGGDAGRSDVFGPGSVAASGSSEPSVASVPPPARSTSPLAHRTRTGSSGGTLSALHELFPRLIARSGLDARPQLGAGTPGGMNLGLLTLTALLIGLVGWAALTWPPLPRR